MKTQRSKEKKIFLITKKELKDPGASNIIEENHVGIKIFKSRIKKKKKKNRIGRNQEEEPLPQQEIKNIIYLWPSLCIIWSSTCF